MYITLLSRIILIMIQTGNFKYNYLPIISQLRQNYIILIL